MMKSERAGTICVPLIGDTRADILLMVEEAMSSGADMIEWRADYYPFCDLSEVKSIILLIQLRIRECPLIVTYRTVSEGGKGKASLKDYARFCEAVVTHPGVSYLDIEYEKWSYVARCFPANRYLDKIILSKHSLIPGVDETVLWEMLKQMQAVHPSVMKVAVIPSNDEEETCLEQFRSIYASNNKECLSALLLIGMGKWGRNLRIWGHLWGNPWTFASLSSESASAPGQLTVSELQKNWQDIKR